MNDKLRNEVGHGARDGVQLIQAIETFRQEISEVLVGFTDLMGGLEDRIKRLEVQVVSLHERFKEEFIEREKEDEGLKEGSKKH